MAECPYSCLKIWEFFSEDMVDSHNIFGPIYRDGVKFIQFGIKSSPEFFCGNSKSISPTVELRKIGGNSGHNESSGYLWNMSSGELDQIVHDFTDGLKMGLVFILVVFLFGSHNGVGVDPPVFWGGV